MKELIVCVLIMLAPLGCARKTKSRDVSGVVVASNVVTEGGDILSGTQSSTYLLIVFRHDDSSHKTYKTFSWSMERVLSRVHECNGRLVLTVQFDNFVDSARCRASSN